MVLRDPVRSGRPARAGRPHPARSSTGRRSPLIAATVYAAGYLPWVIGGLFLADAGRPVPAALGHGRLRRGPGRAGRGHGGAGRAAAASWWRCCSRPRCSRPRSSRRGPPSPRTSCRASATCSAPRWSRRPYYVAQLAARPAGEWRWPSSGCAASLAIDAVYVRALWPCLSPGDPAPGRPRPDRKRSSRHRWPGCGRDSGWCSATRRCGPCCCSAGSWSSTRSPRGSPLPTRQGSAEGRSRPDWCWHRRCSTTTHRDPAVHQVRPPAPADQLDGAAGRADVRDACPDGPPPGPCRRHS